MIPLIQDNDYNVVCEWLAEYYLPKFYAKLKHDGYTNLNNLISHFNANQNNTLHQINTPFVKEYISDITNYMNKCINYVEWLYYIGWLLEICRPILTTLFITLFLLPIFSALLVYFSSTFLFFAKHWSKLKVKKIC